jgi:hypothetical protein
MTILNSTSVLIIASTLFNIQICSANSVKTGTTTKIQTTTKASPMGKFGMDLLGCIHNEMVIMKTQGKSDQELIDFQMNEDNMKGLQEKCFCQLKDKLPQESDRTTEIKEALKKCP